MLKKIILQSVYIIVFLNANIVGQDIKSHATEVHHKISDVLDLFVSKMHENQAYLEKNPETPLSYLKIDKNQLKQALAELDQKHTILQQHPEYVANNVWQDFSTEMTYQQYKNWVKKVASPFHKNVNRKMGL